ncbi:hypothetical protein ACFVRU_58630, partial [Streptomyces sp. NPDC057927]
MCHQRAPLTGRKGLLDGPQRPVLGDAQLVKSLVLPRQVGGLSGPVGRRRAVRLRLALPADQRAGLVEAADEASVGFGVIRVAEQQTPTIAHIPVRQRRAPHGPRQEARRGLRQCTR